MVCPMKPNVFHVLICLILALATALGGVATGRAAGIAAHAASLSPMVICADGNGPQTVLVARDGTPIELPHCVGLLCEDCVQAGSAAILAATPSPSAPVDMRAADTLSGVILHHPIAVARPRSRAPPVAELIA